MHLKKILLLCALAAALAACSGEDTVGPPDNGIPRVRYEPEPGRISMLTSDSLLLSVEVLPDQEFSVEYTLDDSLVVSRTPEYLVVGNEVGERHYRAVVQAGEFWFDDQWTIEVISDAELPVPPPTTPTAEEGPVPGSILLRWDRPPDRVIEVPLRGFQVAWSTSPFSAEEFEAQSWIEVPDNPMGIRQSAIVEGLAERVGHYLRVRAVDVQARLSPATLDVWSEATGSFRLHGVVQRLDAGGWPAPIGSVVLYAGDGDPVTTIEDGIYDFPELPDVAPLVLTAEEGSGSLTFPIETTPLETIDRELPLLFVPRISLVLRNEEGVDIDSDYREFLIAATGTATVAGPYDLHPWPSYPVKVWVWPYTSPEGDQPAYHVAFQRAIDLWNGGATGDRRLVEYVAVEPDFDPSGDPGAFGIMVRVVDGLANIGQVEFVRPAFGTVARTDPEILKISLRSGFQSVEVANHVIAHELGHAIGLLHTPSVTNLMHANSKQAAGVPTPEELFVARYIRHGGQDMMTNWIKEP